MAKKPKITSYSRIRPNLKTGDIVLMGGSSIFSRAIRQITGSPWSHVGMVVWIEEFDTVLLWESTTNGHDKDVQTGKIKRGVQLVPLSKRVAEHTGNIAFRPLSRALDAGEIKKLNAYRKSVKNKTYDFDGLELLRAAIDMGVFWSNRDDLKAYFCSELIADTYRTLGFLGGTLPANEYTPHDFSSTAEKPLALKKVTLGDEIIVQWEK